jgi:hypothetical protein
MVDVLIFVEDPGPALYAAPIPKALSEKGWHSVICAAGLARDVLGQRNIPFLPVDAGLTAAGLIHELKPKVLLTGTSENPDSLGLQLILTARKTGIPTAAFIDAGVNAPFRFRGRREQPLTYAPEWIMVPDEWTKNDFVRIGATPERTVVCGHPQYDHVLALSRTWTASDGEDFRHRLLPGLAKRQRVVVFVSEGSERIRLLSPIPSVDEYSLKGRGDRTGRTEIVIEEFLMAIKTLPDRPYLVLRFHPKDRPDDFQAYRGDFDHMDHDSPPLELVFCADLVVGMTSMLLLEAALLGKQTLSIVPRAAEREWLPTVRHGITPCVMDRSGLAGALQELLQNGGPPQQGPRSWVPDWSLTRLVELVGRILASG